MWSSHHAAAAFVDAHHWSAQSLSQLARHQRRAGERSCSESDLALLAAATAFELKPLRSAPARARSSTMLAALGYPAAAADETRDAGSEGGRCVPSLPRSMRRMREERGAMASAVFEPPAPPSAPSVEHSGGSTLHGAPVQRHALAAPMGTSSGPPVVIMAPPGGGALAAAAAPVHSGQR